MATLGMRGAGQHIRLTKEGTEAMMRGDANFTQLMMTAAMQMEMALMTGVSEPAMGSADRQLFLGARMYRCAHCGTRYESLPSLQGAVKCRSCGSSEIGEER